MFAPESHSRSDIARRANGRLLLIRADGGSQIGFGHLMRCIALAEEWYARGGVCRWATTAVQALDDAGISRRDGDVFELSAAPGTLNDARELRQLAEKTRADWVVTDLPGYQPPFFTSAGSRGAEWMMIHDEPLVLNERISLILNPGPHARPDFYPGISSRCSLLLGLDYALIRSEIRDAFREPKSAAAPRRILVTFGGSDPNDVTARTLQAFAASEFPEGVHFRVIMGPGYRGLYAASGGVFGNMKVEFVRYASNMAKHYAWADLILCAASTTLWEAMYFGLPAVVMPIVLNQRLAYEALANYPEVRRFSGPGQDLVSWFDRLLAGGAEENLWHREAAVAGPRRIDALGINRVVDQMLSRRF